MRREFVICVYCHLPTQDSDADELFYRCEKSWDWLP